MSFDPKWNCEDLAKALCDDLVAAGQLKEKPAFVRTDREAKIANIFKDVDLDGEMMARVSNPGPIEKVIRKCTQGEPWVEQVIAGLVAMLPDEVARADKQIDMDEQTKEEFAVARDSTARRRERIGGGKGGGKDDNFGRFGEMPNLVCYNCEGVGHLARECDQPPKRKGKGKSRGGDQECYNCNEIGHFPEIVLTLGWAKWGKEGKAPTSLTLRAKEKGEGSGTRTRTTWTLVVAMASEVMMMMTIEAHHL
eukprot:CAMPEP_0172904364 /NCGR_PEP_ID=MMETSP1075-20121228/172458_1 /TAXON_ID=2916 /ORGANISM="Ceratium fusus, Strain PA161109" /LENGTH=250 /DNA_ID=CAMNT_0013761369 /DNA_START=14 /DNA_END=767 /DNA_ORIENTATION=+